MSAFSFDLWTNKYIVMLSIPSYSAFYFLVPKSLMPHLISSLFDSISWLNPSDVGDKKMLIKAKKGSKLPKSLHSYFNAY